MRISDWSSDVCSSDLAVVTACSTGAHSIGDAARMIAMDDADVMLAGGAEGAICPLGIAGFAQARALSTNFNDTPEKASRPYDVDRDGRSAERRVGQEVVSTCRYRGWPYH